MQKACGEAVTQELLPWLDHRLQEQIGPRPDGTTWLIRDEKQDGGVDVHFRYPTAGIEYGPYIRESVKLEPGTRTDQQPTGSSSIRPWVAERYADLFGDWHCEVVALDSNRTFWEKATILHAEHHRPTTKKFPERYSRHYSDLASMLRSDQGAAYLADREMLKRVVDWKLMTFDPTGAGYDLATPCTFRLLPAEPWLATLRNDYALMQDMFFETSLPWDEILSILGDAEATINA